MLRSVDAGFEGCGPGRSVYRGALMLGTSQRLPVDEECDRVLCLGHAVERLARRDTSRSAGRDACGYCAPLHEPAVDVDMVRREVIAINASQDV